VRLRARPLQSREELLCLLTPSFFEKSLTILRLELAMFDLHSVAGAMREGLAGLE